MKRVTVRLFESDLDYLKTIAPLKGYNEVIRLLVHKAVRQLQEKENQAAATGEVDLEIEL